MKKVILFLFVFAATGLAYGQVTWSDDFESYNDGDMIAASSSDWRTWLDAAGGDAPVSADQAANGKNSLHIFSANATAAGPMDIILPLPSNYNTGVFHYEMMMYVEGTGAYFNFQATTVEGTAWAIENTFNAGTGMVTLGANPSAAFPSETWFKIEVDVDLTINQWVASIDGDEVARWRNTDNRLGGVNLFPLAGHSYYVDDVMYSHEPFVLGNLDLAVLGSSLPPQLLEGKEYGLNTIIKNLGATPITSYDVAWTDGVNSGTKSVTGVSIAALQEETVVFDETYIANDANSDLTFSVSNINGGADDVADNDTKTNSANVITPAPDKGVFVEEGTGTWCQWCPRGAVGMDYMAKEYPDHFVGIAVHNGDPMVVEDHDSGLTASPAFGGGFPAGVVEREIDVNPAAASLETQFFNYITETTAAVLSADVELFDDGTFRTITATVNATFKENVSGDYRLLAVVSEDHVTGTDSGYNQSNAYAGGGNGPMGGYENLPSSVPASQMVYDHVSRAILGGFDGQEGSLPGTMVAGETYAYTFTYVVPEDQDPTQMSIAAVILEPNGSAHNAKFIKYDQWSTVSSVTNVETHEAFVGISPNPVNDVTFIKLNLDNSDAVSVEIYNNVGQMILSQNYGQLVGKQSIPFNAGNLAKGMYHAKINIGKQFVTRSIIVQ